MVRITHEEILQLLEFRCDYHSARSYFGQALEAAGVAPAPSYGPAEAGRIAAAIAALETHRTLPAQEALEEIAGEARHAAEPEQQVQSPAAGVTREEEPAHSQPPAVVVSEHTEPAKAPAIVIPKSGKRPQPPAVVVSERAEPVKAPAVVIPEHPQPPAAVVPEHVEPTRAPAMAPVPDGPVVMDADVQAELKVEPGRQVLIRTSRPGWLHWGVDEWTIPESRLWPVGIVTYVLQDASGNTAARSRLQTLPEDPALVGVLLGPFPADGPKVLCFTFYYDDRSWGTDRRLVFEA